jgi:uncharacterized Zn-finger protein
MADHGTPHFTNDVGAARVRVGSKEFMCIGANPPFDHPHVFLDMGSSDEKICPYCSTLFVYDEKLKAGECQPPECAWHDDATKAA